MPYIKSAHYNDETQGIEFQISYGGGCREHKFRLHIGSCYETFPIHCEGIKLIDLTTDDFCKSLILEKITISLREAGLDTDYYKGASIQINGAKQSKITIELPC